MTAAPLKLADVVVNGIRYTFEPGGQPDDPDSWRSAKWNGGVLGGTVSIARDGAFYVVTRQQLMRRGFKGDFTAAAVYAQEDRRKAYAEAKQLVIDYERLLKGSAYRETDR